MPQSNRKTRLAIVGASVRAAAQSALRAGFDVVGADLFADADLDGVCPITKIDNYPEGLTDWLAEQDIDAWMYTGALENYPDLVDRMAQMAPLWGVSGVSLVNCRSPFGYGLALMAVRVCVPETRPASDTPSDGRCWLAKTYAHSSGAGVWSLGTDDDWRRARAENAFIQEKIEGRPMSAVYAVGRYTSELIGFTTQLIGGDPMAAPRWGCVGSIGPVPPTPGQFVVLDRIGDCLVGGLRLRGLVGVDLVASGDELSVIEVNPRYAASIEVLERSAGRSAVRSHAACFRDEPLKPWAPAAEGLFGKRIVFATNDARIDEAFSTWAADHGAADQPHPGERIEAGRPVCTVFAEGGSVQEVEAALDQRVRETLARLYA